MTKGKKVLVLLSGVLIGVIGFGLGLTIGSAADVYENISDRESVEIVRVLDLYEKTRSDEVSFDQFWDIWDIIQKQYVNEDVSEVDLYYGAISGLVKGLDDPYSVYFPPEEAKTFAEGLSGEFEGIGAEIAIEDDKLLIIAPLPGSPAEQAGLKPRDTVLKINGEDAYGLTIEQAVTNIRGPRGTTVTLTIARGEELAVQDIAITRDRINVPTVIWEMKEDNLAYLRLNHFNEDTMRQFTKAVREIVLANPDGVIFDLRSNPGGFLDASVEVASEWLAEGELVVQERARAGVRKSHVSTGAHTFEGMPTVVLVDGATASGAEIVAGALKDHDAAILIGRQTFGKGSVQNFELLPDGSALKLTVAKWFTPDGHAIDGEGIPPDQVVPEEAFEGVEDPEDDPDLAAARAYLLGL